MSLEQILEHRRAVREYSSSERIDSARVQQCIRLAQLAPTSSNMQLYEVHHVKDEATKALVAEACLGQATARTAQEFVVFVVRQDLWRQRAAANLSFARENIRKHSPAERVAKRIKDQETYYGKVMPLLYKRACGFLGLGRKLLVSILGLSRPMVQEVSEGDMRVVCHKSCALVAQTFMLAMSEAGYDTCPIEGYDSKRLRKALGLSRGAAPSLVVSCGIRSEQGVAGERFRVPFEEIYKEH